MNRANGKPSHRNIECKRQCGFKKVALRQLMAVWPSADASEHKKAFRHVWHRMAAKDPDKLRRCWHKFKSNFRLVRNASEICTCEELLKHMKNQSSMAKAKRRSQANERHKLTIDQATPKEKLREALQMEASKCFAGKSQFHACLNELD